MAKEYNHPSVVLYSISNEVTEPAKEEGVQLAKKLTESFHMQDTTRPVTAGINITLLLMASMGIDMTGSSEEKQDVSSTDYNEMAMAQGERMVMAAASDAADAASSPVLDLLDIAGYNYASSRYELEGEKHPGRVVVGSETYPQALSKNWEKVEKLPYLIGDFMWTAWDYLG